MINICVPVLKRYDLLRGMLSSLATSTVKPDAIYIINNGRDEKRLEYSLIAAPTPKVFVETPLDSMGIAESWNWFIKNVPEDRIIVNDDVFFAHQSIEKMVSQPVDLVFAAKCGFSCFLIRDSCVAKIGLFDETISPGYGYYEDDDYLQRLDGRGTREASATSATVDCGAIHLKSQTLAVNSPSEMQEHHRRFRIAQTNYMKKWGLTSL